MILWYSTQGCGPRILNSYFLVMIIKESQICGLLSRAHNYQLLEAGGGTKIWFLKTTTHWSSGISMKISYFTGKISRLACKVFCLGFSICFILWAQSLKEFSTICSYKIFSIYNMQDLYVDTNCSKEMQKSWLYPYHFSTHTLQQSHINSTLYRGFAAYFLSKVQKL